MLDGWTQIREDAVQRGPWLIYKTYYQGATLYVLEHYGEEVGVFEHLEDASAAYQEMTQ